MNWKSTRDAIRREDNDYKSPATGARARHVELVDVKNSGTLRIMDKTVLRIDLNTGRWETPSGRAKVSPDHRRRKRIADKLIGHSALFSAYALGAHFSVIRLDNAIRSSGFAS